MPGPTDPAAGYARRLLREFGDPDVPIDLPPTHPAADWARSGAMALTGRRDGPPLLSPGAPASLVRGASAVLAGCTGTAMPGPELLSERAAIVGLGRRGPWSAGGSFRPVRTADGWIGVSLSRPADLDALPALVEAPVDEPWSAVTAWAAGRDTAAAAARLRLLDLPAAPIPAEPAGTRRGPIAVARGGPRNGRGGRAPLVVDLSSLWAGPLCARLLGLAGARIVKVESRQRPDGARRGSAAFFRHLHPGHESVVLDFAHERPRLLALLAEADVVVEASRPRALRRLGIHAEEYAAGGTVWASITAYGRGSGDADRCGFGDDVAAGAGLVAWEDGVPLPVGDAIADPLTGVSAAAAIALALRGGHGCVIDVSMHDVAVAAAGASWPAPARVVPDPPGWSVLVGGTGIPVAPPVAPR